MDIIKQLEWRYAVKSFSDKPLPEEKISRVERGLQLTASSYGLQFMKYIWVTDIALRQQLFEHSYHQKQIIEASHLLVLCRMSNIDTDEIPMHIERVAKERNQSISSLDKYAVHLDNAILNMSSVEQSQWMNNQIYLAMGSLLTICAAEAIDACPMEGFIPEEYDKVLGLKEKNLSSVLVCPIGYRSEADGYANQNKVRKSIDDLFLTV